VNVIFFDFFMPEKIPGLFSVFRFFIEYLRYYEPNFIFGFFTASQIISVILFVCALVILVEGNKPQSRKAQ